MGQLSALHGTLIVGGVYLLVCGGFGAYVASAKGRSRLEGFVFGLVLGPIGVVAVGTLPTVERKAPAARSAMLDEKDDEAMRARLGARSQKGKASAPTKKLEELAAAQGIDFLERQAQESQPRPRKEPGEVEERRPKAGE